MVSPTDTRTEDSSQPIARRASGVALALGGGSLTWPAPTMTVAQALAAPQRRIETIARTAVIRIRLQLLHRPSRYGRREHSRGPRVVSRRRRIRVAAHGPPSRPQDDDEPADHVGHAAGVTR